MSSEPEMPSTSSTPPSAQSPPSSSSLDSSYIPRTSSPLRSTTTPLTAPVPLPALDDNLVDFPDAPGRHRGFSFRRSKPLSSSNPAVTVTSSPPSTEIPLPEPREEEGKLSSLFRSRSVSPSGRVSEKLPRIGDGAGATPPGAVDSSPAASVWWGDRRNIAKLWEDSPKPPSAVPPERQEAWLRTRERVAIAARSVLGNAASIAHELLAVSADALNFVPVPGLSAAANTLLLIWDAVDHVDLNAVSCLRLTERCADTLLSVRQEVHEAGDSVTEELQAPIAKLQSTFEAVARLMSKEANRPFLKRYLKRQDIMQQIAACDTELRAAVEMFNLSVCLRILKQTHQSEQNRRAEMKELWGAVAPQHQSHEPENALMLSGVGSEAISSLPTGPSAQGTLRPSSEPSTDRPLKSLASLQSAQNNADLVQDTEGMREILRLALQTTNDAEMLGILQIKRQEMPEAIKTLQRALEQAIEHDSGPERSTIITEAPPTKKITLMRRASVSASPKSAPASGSGDTSDVADGTDTGIEKDTLHREFLESGIDALRRMSRGQETNLPSWTITKFEVDRDQKIGIGFFSDVYKGRWRGRTVAIKVLAETTPRELFKREVVIWKTLDHPNVLELYGASSTTGDPPWFFVSPYEKNGSLVEFLKRVRSQTRSSGSPHLHHAGSLPSSSPMLRGERTATYPVLLGVHSNQASPKRLSPTRDTEYRKSRDLHRFIYEIAKGMEYLHGKNILHGDLKAANVLVNDNFRCVISDFGQSEMRFEALRATGPSPPHGTLRWQAPELMREPSHLTQEMDVYAYAISCVEVLTWGTLPWLLADDDSVRHLVLDRDERPALPSGSKYLTPSLQELIRACWSTDPAQRPSFARIVSEVRRIRSTAGEFLDDNSPLIAELPTLKEEPRLASSPDIRPISLLAESPPLETSDPHFGQPSHMETSVPSEEIKFPQPVFFTPSRSSTLRTNPSLDDSDSKESIYITQSHGPHASPAPAEDIIAQTRNERRYRLTLTHKFHPSLVLPLWEPTPVDLGAVGYLSKPSGTFITLFNAFHPYKSPNPPVQKIPSIAGYGRVTSGSQRMTKKNNLLDIIVGIITPKKDDATFPQPVSRRSTFELKAGHKAAILHAETHEYRYMVSDDTGRLDAPKRWFKATIDFIQQIYGAEHHIQREDIFLVVGTLRAQNYALFVSHNHPEGHAHFNVFASPKEGQPWGMFTTDAEYDGVGPSVGDTPSESGIQSASKVSHHGESWDTVLLARLRFKPDSSEPTTL